MDDKQVYVDGDEEFTPETVAELTGGKGDDE